MTQISTDVVEELILSSEINSTLQQLETAWAELDQATIQLAQVNQVLSQLQAITNNASETITALNNIVNDWQTICDAINGSDAEWNTSGYNQVAEWATRMVRIQFYGTHNQTVS